jgi:transcription factor C subunit 6
MRLRTTRGVRKRYTEEHVVFDDDDEPVAVPEDRAKDDDFEALSDGPEVHDEDDHEEEADPTSDEDAGPDDEEGADESKDQPVQPKRQRNAGAGRIQSRKSFHDIPHYPLETRIVTRVYAGPLRRYARYSALRDAMYGPEYQRIKIIWDLEIRWANFPVLPPKLPPEDPQGVMPSPWLPRGFERDQRKRAALWYDAYQLHAPEVQRSHALPPEDTNRFLPKDPGDLVTITGPWDKQQEFVLGQGGCLAVGPRGIPVDAPNEEHQVSSGWMFNVGSIPLAIAWAPFSRQDIQILAVASIPFSDQELAKPGDPSTAAAADTTGCIQFWDFVPVKQDAGRLASPSMVPPRLAGAICFNWGRPKRLQFCPVPLDSSSTIGMLAVLCGDGRARVIDAKNADDAERPFTGSSRPADYHNALC